MFGNCLKVLLKSRYLGSITFLVELKNLCLFAQALLTKILNTNLFLNCFKKNLIPYN